MGLIFYHYQTLIAGGFAIFAAFASLWGMWWLSNKERKRRLRGRRALMPAELSEICGYAQACAQIFRTHDWKQGGSSKEQPPVKVPRLSDRTVDNFKDLVEHLEERDVDAVSDLLGCYQVQRARLMSTVEMVDEERQLGRVRELTIGNLESSIRATVQLYLSASKLFDFARRETDHAPPLAFTEKEVSGTLILLGLTDVLPEPLMKSLRSIRSVG